MEQARGEGRIYYFEESSHKLFKSSNVTSCIYYQGPRAPKAAASPLRPETSLHRLLAQRQGVIEPIQLGLEEAGGFF